MWRKKTPAAADKAAANTVASDPIVVNPDAGTAHKSTAPVASGPENTAENTAGNETQKPTRTRWFRVTIIILFGLFYTWDLFSALWNFVGKLDELRIVNEVRALNSYVLIETPWIPLVASLLVPPVIFVLALLVARKRNVGVLAMVLLAGLGVVAAISLSLTAVVLSVT